MNNDIKLKPCPFCGGKVQYCERSSEEFGIEAAFICDGCGAMFMIGDIDDERQRVVEKWNTRVESTFTRKEIALIGESVARFPLSTSEEKDKLIRQVAKKCDAILKGMAGK